MKHAGTTAPARWERNKSREAGAVAEKGGLGLLNSRTTWVVTIVITQINLFI